MLGALSDQTFRNVNMCQSREPPVERRLQTALHPLQCNDPYAKKRERPSPLVCRIYSVTHLGFNFALSVIVEYFNCILLISLLNCMQSVLLFVLLHAFCTSLRMNPFRIYNFHSDHQANTASVTGYSRLFYGYSHDTPSYRQYHLKDQKLVV